ncbi:hypothetical protein HDV06_006225 [Boothiomyces sp. JEL0866]|nr:hypothetical protein HDV06_006225 [Boothiomyces sp. JEL0866]
MGDSSPVEKKLAETLALREQELEAACEIAHLFLQQQEESELKINRLMDSERKQQEMVRTLEIMGEELRAQSNLNERHIKKKQQIIDKQAKEMNKLKSELVSINEQLLELDSLCADVDRIRVENKKLRAKNDQISLDKQNLLNQLYQCNDQIYDLNQKIQEMSADYRALELASNRELQEIQQVNNEKMQELKSHYEMEIRRLKEIYESEILHINQTYNCDAHANEYPLHTLENIDSLKVVRSDTMDTLAENEVDKDPKPQHAPRDKLSLDFQDVPEGPVTEIDCPYNEIFESDTETHILSSSATTEAVNAQIESFEKSHKHQKLTPYEYLFLQRLLLLSKQPHNLTLIFGKRLFMREKFKLLYNILSLLLLGK